MSRFSQNQYQWRVMATTVVYIVWMFTVWPLVRTTTSVPFKLLLALATVSPVIYIIALMAWRIRSCDELEQRVHLIGLGVATAVVGALSLLCGFLHVAGVLKLDGSSLLLVFPALVWSYSAAGWAVKRRYGGGFFCEGDPAFSKVVHLVTGVILLLLAWLFRSRLPASMLGMLCGTGVFLMAMGMMYGLVQRRRKRIDE